MALFSDIEESKYPGHKRPLFYHILSTIGITVVMVAIIITVAVKLKHQITGRMLSGYQQTQLQCNNGPEWRKSH